MFQQDVKNVILNGELEEQVHMSLPGYDDNGKYCRLKKALYGLE